MDTWRHAGIRRGGGAPDADEPRGEVDFELRRAMGRERDTSNNVRWQEAQREPVRGVEDDCAVDREAESRSGGRRRSDRARNIRDCDGHGDRSAYAKVA